MHADMVAVWRSGTVRRHISRVVIRWAGYYWVQTMSQMVNERPRTRLSDGGLQKLHSVVDVSIDWLEGTVMASFILLYKIVVQK